MYQAEALLAPDKWNIVSDMGVLLMALYGPSGREWPDSLQVLDTVWRERQVYFETSNFLTPASFVAVPITGRRGP